MGAQLVGQAFAFAARHQLKSNEALLLLFMAHTALDADDPPRYFASRERSAIAIGRMVPDVPAADDPDSDKLNAERASVFELLRRATNGLLATGAVERLHGGRGGRTAEYVLRLSPEPNKKLALQSNKLLALSPNDLLGAGPTKSWPLGTKEEPEGKGRGEMTGSRPSHLSAVERAETAA